MKVKDLIARLQDYDEDAEVLLVTQEQWPFEYGIAGLTDRLTCGDPDFDDNDDDGSTDDVFIVEGHQLRYGVKSAWSSAS